MGWDRDENGFLIYFFFVVIVVTRITGEYVKVRTFILQGINSGVW